MERFSQLVREAVEFQITIESHPGLATHFPEAFEAEVEERLYKIANSLVSNFDPNAPIK